MRDVVRVWCLRHGESENVTTGTAGMLPLAPLTVEGHRQAAAAAERLAGEPLTAVWCSEALRARQTAAHLRDRFDLPVHTLPGLNEVGIGSKEGATDAATRRRTAEVLHSWVVDGNLDDRVADGENGHQVRERVTDAFAQIALAASGGTVAVVGHVASLTVGLGLLCGLGRHVWGAPLPHATPFLVAQEAGIWRCVSWPGVVDEPMVG
ncbi:histidine phosphatase family protein [Micromonospora sp. PPF5-17]|uniref:Histidine phosphatase family protein n=1 Tax=Micromonospora solifontis TaxID=2487138 RepID=A0ABX9WCX9_9ACTN|nr:MULTISPECIES: histidine phosphatase family protein [Micromonospora]NES38296.1 histidine phosphatase family protein [Micromonospora solifontis]NES58667.1 histidine phosphatase family protein [Micromonospora sp. PPF5-6]RNL96361.1 histidine phosphatase family protein [Micromonospora solifontis]